MALPKEEKQRRIEERKLKKYSDTHKIVNDIEYKLCSKCGKWLPCTGEYFYKNKSNSIDGLHPYCKKCSIKKAKESTKRNYDKHLEALRRNNARPETIEKMRANANKQRESGYQKQYQKKHPEKFKQYREKRQHKDHNITKSEWKFCKSYFNCSCAYCGISEIEAKRKYGNVLHKEHVNHEGTNNLSNCIPACKSCNSLKWKFSLDEWYNEENPIFKQENKDRILKWINDDYKKYIT